MWPYSWTHVGTPSHLGHMDRVAATMPSQAHAGAAQEAPNIGQWEGQDVPLVRPSSCTVKGGIPSSRRYLPTYLCLLAEPSIVDDQPPFPGHLLRNNEGGEGPLAGAWYQPFTLHEFFQLGFHGFKPVLLQRELTLLEHLVWMSEADFCFAIPPRVGRSLVGFPLKKFFA